MDCTKKTLLFFSLLLIAVPPVWAGEWIFDQNNCKLWNEEPTPGESITWSGGCIDGIASGNGMLVWFKESKATGEKYDGEMRNGKRNGKGTNTWSSGARYDGEWHDNKQNGKGTITWPNGSRYEGAWRDNKFSGFGSLALVRGDKSIQGWEEDGDGIWVGDRYVIQGMFEGRKIIVRKCASIADCDKKAREEYARRERNNAESCNRLYVGKAVKVEFYGMDYTGLITGISPANGVASVKITERTRAGEVHERRCSEYF